MESRRPRGSWIIKVLVLDGCLTNISCARSQETVAVHPAYPAYPWLGGRLCCRSHVFQMRRYMQQEKSKFVESLAGNLGAVTRDWCGRWRARRVWNARELLWTKQTQRGARWRLQGAQTRPWLPPDRAVGGQGGTRCQAPHSASEPSVRSRSGSSSRSRLGQKALKIRFQYDPSLTSQIYLYAFIPSSLPFFYILRISVILKSVSLVLQKKPPRCMWPIV